MIKNITIICLPLAFFSIFAASLITQLFEYSPAAKKSPTTFNAIKLIAQLPDIKLKLTPPRSKQSRPHNLVEGVRA